MSERTVDLDRHGREIERVLDDMVRLGERARTLRDAMTSRRGPKREQPWDGLGAEMQETYRRNSAAYAAQVEGLRLASELDDEHNVELGVIHYGTDIL